MKIKTKKKLNLPELIQHIMDNEELRGLYYTPTPLRGVVKVSKSGEVLVEGVYADDTFNVEVEEDLTEETLISGMTGVYYDRQRKELDLTVMQRTAIKYQLGDDVEDILLAIYVGPTLIWTKEYGIPESGVLEAGE